MTHTEANGGDSPEGGSIPGSGGRRAFTLSGHEPSAVPVLIAVPHAGRAYTGALLDRMRNPELTAMRLEDRYVDRLAARIAETTGALLLVADAPRAMIDLNRAPDDVDWEMFPLGSVDRRREGGDPAVRRARNGLGLIPRRLPGLGELWKRRHERAELDARISGIHAPYHQCLAAALERLRARWGAALLIDIHSMPSLPAPAGAQPPEFVVGDRFGRSCDGGLIAGCFGFFAAHDRRVAHNRPYAGGYVLERHGTPATGTHALQLEIDRASYLDARLAEPGERFEELARLLGDLVLELAEQTAELGRRQGGPSWAEAAE